MGTFSVSVTATGPAGRSAEFEALVDTGATHSLLPSDLLAGLGVEPIDRVSFQLADERTVEEAVGEAPLLGATTLELFNLAVDPVSQRLVPVPGLLKQVGPGRTARSVVSRASRRAGPPRTPDFVGTRVPGRGQR
jgi:predicted aspartyl protease